jgi:hypothetical protein
MIILAPLGTKGANDISDGAESREPVLEFEIKDTNFVRVWLEVTFTAS